MIQELRENFASQYVSKLIWELGMRDNSLGYWAKEDTLCINKGIRVGDDTFFSLKRKESYLPAYTHFQVLSYFKSIGYVLEIRYVEKEEYYILGYIDKNSEDARMYWLNKDKFNSYNEAFDYLCKTVNEHIKEHKKQNTMANIKDKFKKEINKLKPIKKENKELPKYGDLIYATDLNNSLWKKRYFICFLEDGSVLTSSEEPNKKFNPSGEGNVLRDPFIYKNWKHIVEKDIIKYRPFEWADRDLIRGKWIRPKSDITDELLVINVFKAKNDKFHIRFNSVVRDGEELLNNYEFLDGSPCGILINKK